MTDAKGPKPHKYAVGYGQPPEATRWKPGQSGNSKGRPKGSKGSKGFAKLIHDELNRKIEITERGVRRRISQREFISRRYVQQAMKGDPKAIAFFVAKEPDFTPPEPIELTIKPGMTVAEAAAAYAKTRRQFNGED